MVASTVLLAVPITESVPSAKFATSTRPPSGSTATPSGWEPTGTLPAIVLVAVVDHGDRVAPAVRHVEGGAGGVNGDARGSVADGDGARHGVAGRVEARDAVAVEVRHVDPRAIRMGRPAQRKPAVRDAGYARVFPGAH